MRQRTREAVRRQRSLWPRGARASRLCLAVMFLAAIPIAFAPQPAHATYPVFTFTGAGYGHGIGLSQWGAKGWADKGKDWRWISTYYFPGSYLGGVDDFTVSVHLRNNQGSLSSWTLRPASGRRLRVAGTWGRAGESFTFTIGSGPRFVATGSQGTRVQTGTIGTNARLSITTDASPRTIQVAQASGYRHQQNLWYRGDMEFRYLGGGLQLRNILGVEGYLKGVLPIEMGAVSWNREAHKAQAVVARSYAYYAFKDNRPLACSTADQAYVGYSFEHSELNAAVDATRISGKGQVVKHSSAPARYDRVVQTFYHSSSGGHTANIEHIWSGTGYPSGTYPYFRGVSDQYSASPNYDPWRSPKTYDGRQLAAALAPRIVSPPGAGSSVWVRNLTVRHFDSDYVSGVDVHWSNGTTTPNVSGTIFRQVLGLPSTKFMHGPGFDRVAYRTRYETAVEVSKRAYPANSDPGGVVIACGEDSKFADAVAASGLAGVIDAPVLLVRSDVIDGFVREEVQRLKAAGAKKAYVVGGTNSVSGGTEQYLRNTFGSANVKRLAGGPGLGTDRYATAASVALEMKDLGVDTRAVLVASGETWTDAAIAGTISASSGRPVVLTAGQGLPDGSRAALAALGARETAVFGGPVTISDTAISQIIAVTGESKPTRRFGMTGGRYDVAVQAANWAISAFGHTADRVFVSSGEVFADSVTGGVLAAGSRSPLVLTARTSVPHATATFLNAHQSAPGGLVVVGGVNTITNDCARQMARILE